MFKVGKLVEQTFLSAFLYLISYQLLMFIWGEQGLLAYQKLLLVQQQMESHLKELEKHQRGLSAHAERIRNDPDYINIEARGLGYYSKDDKLILVNTWTQAQPAPSPGEQLTPDLEVLQSEAPSAIWFYSLLLAASLWLLIRLLHFGRTERMPKEFSEFSEVSKSSKFPEYPRRVQNSGNPKAIRRNANHEPGSRN
ncbi:MAG: septum formation initiator family protein, partial [Spirochaetota bacterium]